MNHKIDRDTYIIPPNFIESGTSSVVCSKPAMVIEAGILAFAIWCAGFFIAPSWPDCPYHRFVPDRTASSIGGAYRNFR